jgi:coenzyme PQQ synthesis protein D (PqqD)
VTMGMDTQDRGAQPLRLRTRDVMWQTVEDEIIVLDLRGSHYFRLNKSAAFLWNLLLQETSHAALAAGLVRRYRIDNARASADAEAFVQRLRTKRLLES